jgi:hypothetical protein
VQYLSNHWNPANSQFLIGAGNITTETPAANKTVEPVINWVPPVGNDHRYDVSTGTIALQATAGGGAGSGVEQVEFWRYDNADKKWLMIGVDNTASSVSTNPASTLHQSAPEPTGFLPTPMTELEPGPMSRSRSPSRAAALRP